MNLENSFTWFYVCRLKQLCNKNNNNTISSREVFFLSFKKGLQSLRNTMWHTLTALPLVTAAIKTARGKMLKEVLTLGQPLRCTGLGASDTGALTPQKPAFSGPPQQLHLFESVSKGPKCTDLVSGDMRAVPDPLLQSHPLGSHSNSP